MSRPSTRVVPFSHSFSRSRLKSPALPDWGVGVAGSLRWVDVLNQVAHRDDESGAHVAEFFNRP